MQQPATALSATHGAPAARAKPGTVAMCFVTAAVACLRAVIGCRNLAQALDRSLRFYSLILDDISGSVLRGPQEASLVLREHPAVATPRVFGQEVLLMLLHGVACWLVGRRIPILRAEFNYAEPQHSAEYRLMYSINLSFRQPHTAIVFSAHYLDLPVVQQEGSAKEFLRTAPENILVKYKNGSSLTARIRRRLASWILHWSWDFPSAALFTAPFANGPAPRRASFAAACGRREHAFDVAFSYNEFD